MKRSRKLLALFLLLVFAVTAIPTMAFAEGETTGDILRIELPTAVTVEKGGENAPGLWTFVPEIFDMGNSNTEEYRNVVVNSDLITVGFETCEDFLTISGPADEVRAFMSEGFFVRLPQGQEENWTFSDAVYFVSYRPVEVPPAEGVGEPVISFEPFIFPTQAHTVDGETVYEYGETPVDKMTFVNIYTDNSTPVTLNFPFKKTVKQGGNTAPGKATFELELLDGEELLAAYEGVTFSAAVTTDGVGTFDGTLSFTGPRAQLESVLMLQSSILVREKKGTADGWTYSDAVWYLYVGGYDADEDVYLYSLFPAQLVHDAEYGDYYVMAEDSESDFMLFENTYTHNATVNPQPEEGEKETGSGETETGKTGDTSATPDGADNGKSDIGNESPVKPAATGDSSHVLLWVLLAVSAVALCGVAVLTVYKKKHAEG